MEEVAIPHNVTLNVINTTRLLEESRNINSNILKLYQLNRKVDGWPFYTLIVAYTFLILLGTFGNILVVYVVIGKPAMRTVRNLFILNLAISDLLLCLITMPLTLMEILTRYWPLGHNIFICKVIGTFEAISIFVSTFSITAIALDRYQVIVYPMRDSLHRLGAIIILGGIWLLSVVLASPMYFCRKLEILSDMNFTQIGLDGLAYCLEEWTIPHGRALYSIFVLIIQYVVPIVIVSVAYSRICKKLQYRYVSTTVDKRESELSRRKSREDRRRKTNSLFIAIALVYCISWLPLNLCNVIYDAANPFGEDFQTTIVVFAACHMMGMSSACSNPFLYGWLNDNFRKEFKEIFSLACPCLRAIFGEDCNLLKCNPSKRKINSKCFNSSFEKVRKNSMTQNPNEGSNQNRHWLVKDIYQNLLKMIIIAFMFSPCSFLGFLTYLMVYYFQTGKKGNESNEQRRNQKSKVDDFLSTQDMSTKVTEMVTTSIENGEESQFETETL